MVPASAFTLKAPLGLGGWNKGLDRETSVLMGNLGACSRTSISLLVLSEYISTEVW